MTATQLIRALAEAIEAHGDLPVEAGNAAGDWDYVAGVCYVHTHTHRRLEITTDTDEATYRA